MNKCTYKQCNNLTNNRRRHIKNRFICDDCYKIIKEIKNEGSKKRRKTEEFKLKNGNKIRKQKRDSYDRLKKNPEWMEKTRERCRKKTWERNQEGTAKRRLQILKSSLNNKQYNCDITEDQMKDILNNGRCYISGIKISIASTIQLQSHFLDRIGNIEDGGDGKHGGNYTINNVRPSLFFFNQSRERMGLTDIEMEKLFEPIRESQDPKILEILDKIAKLPISHKRKKTD